jgi:hypothetical protein
MHTCECGHEPSSHYGDTGACEHITDSPSGEFSYYDCHCPRYSRDDYDDDVRDAS